MSFRSDSLHDRLTEPQRHELMICIKEAGEAGKADRFKAGLALCESWGIKTSRTAVHDFFKRYYYGWRVELGAFIAQRMQNMPSYEKELRHVTVQKIFGEITDADCSMKDLLMVRALQLEEQKIAQRAEVLEHNKEKFRESLRSKLEAGMNALFDQIKDNPQALAAFETMKAVIAK